MDGAYKTVRDMSTAEIVEKRSRFIAYVRPVSTEEAALDYLNYIRQKHRDARHNVYAYIIRDNNIMRYSDDGEPGGTAGMPILEVMRGRELTDLIVVVTRYFGGILLGTGGLVHAYSKAAKEGIDAAGVAEMALCRRLFISCDYSSLGKVQYEAAEFDGVFCGETEYGETVKLEVFVPVGREDEFAKRLIDKTSAGVDISQGEISYFEKG